MSQQMHSIFHMKGVQNDFSYTAGRLKLLHMNISVVQSQSGRVTDHFKNSTKSPDCKFIRNLCKKLGVVKVQASNIFRSM